MPWDIKQGLNAEIKNEFLTLGSHWETQVRNKSAGYTELVGTCYLSDNSVLFKL